MDNKTIVVLIFFAMIVTGCASFGDIIPAWRTHGVKQIDAQQDVWEEYNCQNENLPLVKIEHNEITPTHLKPKKKMECNHRFVYGMCAEKHTNELIGILHTRIFHRGKMLIDDIEDNYSIKPGRWRVDTLIIVPKHVEPGVYTLETEFVGPDTGFFKRSVGFKINNTFIVEPREEKE